MSEENESHLENNDSKSDKTSASNIENSRTSQKLSEYEKEGRNTSSTDPEMMESRIFIGNLASDKVSRPEIEALFEPYGKILGVSLHKSFGFVQYDNKESARQAVLAENGRDFNNLKMDICIATERRKDSSGDRSSGRGRGSGGRSGDRDRWGDGDRRRRNRSRSLSPRGRYRDRGRGPRDREDRYRRDRRSPRRRMGPDHFRDSFYSPRDLYMLTRDDPFDRFGPDPYSSRFYPPPPPMRGGGPPFDYLPPRRDMLDPWEGPDLPPMREPPPRDIRPYDREGLRPPLRDERDMMREPSSKSLAPPKRSIEMEIFLVSNQQKDYAQMVQSRVESLGILVDIIQLNPSVSLVEALNNAARRGLLYTIIITAQHMQHQSVTLTILHGRNPQEHKNMPLADAINLIDRDFSNYCISHRGTLPTTKPSAPFMKSAASNNDPESSLISRAALGEDLSTNELNALISSLQKKKQQQDNSRSLDDQQSFSAEDIQRHQADLQAKIFSLLGPKAVVPSSSGISDNSTSASKSSMGPPSRFPDRVTGRGRGGATGTRGGAFGGRGGTFGGRGGRGGAFNSGRGSGTINKLGPGSNSFGRGTAGKRGSQLGRGRGATNFSGDSGSGFGGNFRSQAYGGFC